MINFQTFTEIYIVIIKIPEITNTGLTNALITVACKNPSSIPKAAEDNGNPIYAVFAQNAPIIKPALILLFPLIILLNKIYIIIVIIIAP